MRKPATAIVFAAFVLALSGGPVTASPPIDEWHRLNPGTENEHERLTCVESAAHWSCAYDKLPEPGYHIDETVGLFQGRNVTGQWTCPDWLSDEICDNVVAVYAGRATYFPDGGGLFRVGQDYIVTEIDDQAVLYQYWVDQFACPWFRTFDEAADANPGSTFDCETPPA